LYLLIYCKRCCRVSSSLAGKYLLIVNKYYYRRANLLKG
jgi:hypothetical protein